MKKQKNKPGNQFSKLIPVVRKFIKKYAHHHTTISTLLKPGLASIFDNDFCKNYKTFEEIFLEETKTTQNKYKKLNILNIYWQIRRQDIHNFYHNNYPVNPRDASYIDENGKKIIRL